jgi:hypothetical protein
MHDFVPAPAQWDWNLPLTSVRVLARLADVSPDDAVRWLLLVTLVLASCAAPTALSRARALETDAVRCDRFSTFEPTLAAAREALPMEARGDELVPASQALTAARVACARTTIDGLLERQQREGRPASATEVQALTKAFGPERVLELLRARWGPDADRFAPDIASAAYRPGPTPDQPAPTEPVDPRGNERPALPGALETGVAADCLRRPTAEAATCLGDWSRDGAETNELDLALRAFVSRVEREMKGRSDEAGATLLGAVFAGLSLPSDRPALAPLVTGLTQRASRLLPQAEQLAAQGLVERGALLARPFLSVDVTRRRAEPLCRAAARKHTQLANDAGPRPLARAVHLAVAAWLLGEPATPPSLEPGRWDLNRWDCPTAKPTLPTLPGGMTARLVASCRKAAAASHPTQSQEASMRTFEFEASLQRLEVRADVSLTCGGRVTTKRLEASDVVLDLPTPETRPGPLDGPLAQLVREASAACASSAESDVSTECRRLEAEPLDVTQTFTRLALRLGAWPECFTPWFTRRYDVPPPRLSPGR